MDFIHALEQNDLNALRSVPKADLHCHAYFSTHLESVERWLGRSIEEAPPLMRGLDGMIEYAAEHLDPHINNRAGYEFVVESAVKDAINDGVAVLEMSFDIRSSWHFECGVSEFCDFVQQLRCRNAPGVDLRPELGIPRAIVGQAPAENQISEALSTGTCSQRLTVRRPRGWMNRPG